MTEVDFYKLERPVQDRFCDATRFIGMPTPLLSVPSQSKKQVLWFSTGATLLVLAGAIVSSGFGQLDHPRAIAPVWLLAVYCVLLTSAAFCLLRGLFLVHSVKRQPYRSGLYLFPAGVVDARQEPLRVYRLSEIEAAPGGAPGEIRFRLKSGGEVVFPAGSEDKAAQVRAALDEARAQYEHAIQTQNRREQALLDPLVDSGFSSPFSPKLPIVRRTPAWHVLAPAIAIAAGLTLGAGIWVVRNRLSEAKLYQTATEAGTVEAFASYLERGGPRPEVRDVLLPRAELARAVAEGRLEAIEKYAAAHPSSKIASEIDAAIRAALDRELAEASDTGSVLALREFAERRKAYEYVKAPVAAATTALYKKALAGFTAEANAQNGEVLSFFERLLAHARSHGPKVSVRFVRDLPESTKTADLMVRLSAYFQGAESVPSQYFKGRHAEAREEKAAAELIARLQKPFSKEILDFSRGPTLAQDTPSEAPTELPSVTEPTLFVRHTPNLAGGYMNPKPRGVFVGLGMMLEGVFVIPDGGPPLTLKASSWKTPNMTVLKKDGATVADVYEDMASVGFERFTRSFLSYVFASP